MGNFNFVSGAASENKEGINASSNPFATDDDNSSKKNKKKKTSDSK